MDSVRHGYYVLSGSAEQVVTGPGRYYGGTPKPGSPGSGITAYDSATTSGLTTAQVINYGSAIPSNTGGRGIRFEDGIVVNGTSGAEGVVLYLLDEDSA